MTKSTLSGMMCLIAIGLIASAIHAGAEERKAVYVGSKPAKAAMMPSTTVS